jgi:MoxR-like ATPase
MTYSPLFRPDEQRAQRGRRPDAVQYLYDEELELAVNVALAADRPLLLRGLPGTGKSTLAADVAFCLGRRYESAVVTSRTQAQDLQWRFDAVRRLADAQAKKKEDDVAYVEPGVLWRAFSPASAARYGAKGKAKGTRSGVKDTDAVVLLDEMDKADPDVPNDLLVVIDERHFYVPEVDVTVAAPKDLKVLIVITTNNERELPAAFVRRCVVFDIPMPREHRLRAIAARHFDDLGTPLVDEVYGLLKELATSAGVAKLREPSTAEFLDALRACRDLGIREPSDARWRRIAEAAMWKHAPRPKDGA